MSTAGSLSDELTSPSPSPPPEQSNLQPSRKPGRPKKAPRKAPPRPVSITSKPLKRAGPLPQPPRSAGLDTAMDSGSELSELTEEEEDTGRDINEEDEEDEEDQLAYDDDEAKAKSPVRATKGRVDSLAIASGSHMSSSPSKNKPMPLPMWGVNAEPPAAQEEEEEEEVPEHPSVMEEESGDSGDDRAAPKMLPPDIGKIEIIPVQESRDMEVDPPETHFNSLPIPVLSSTAAAAVTLLDLFAVASSPPASLAPVDSGISAKRTVLNDPAAQDGDEEMTESEDDQLSDVGEGRELDDAVELPAISGPDGGISTGGRSTPSAPIPEDDLDVASREGSPESEQSGEEDVAEDPLETNDLDAPDAEVDVKGPLENEDVDNKSDIEADGEDVADQSEDEEDEAELDADKSDNEEVKSEVEEDVKSDADIDDEVQPAHRAEALEVLAGIELKYALLREAIYLERMEGLGWEEGLVLAGTHPELLHIQHELAARRDRRIELATKKRTLDHLDAERKRRAGEIGVWGWWKFSRDNLQADMISEANRKRRKLDRDRRSNERQLPQRRSAPPPPSHTVPAAIPNLRQIIKAAEPFRILESGARRRRGDSRPHENASPAQPLAFPDLTPLNATDIQSDLNFMLQHQLVPPPTSSPVQQHPASTARPVQPPTAPRAMPPAAQPQPMYEPNFGRAPPPPGPYPPSMHSAFAPPPAGYGRMHHHHSAPPPVHHSHHVAPYPEMGYAPYIAGPGRRAESPAGRWPMKPGEWHPDARPPPPMMMGSLGRSLEEEERERERLKNLRERDRDRDDMERRDYLMRGPPQGAPPPSHHHTMIAGPHHHHRPHHHHVVHHHAPPSASHLPGHSHPRPSLSPRASREFHESRPSAEMINLDHRKRSNTGPPVDDRERPLATPFVMNNAYSGRSLHTPPPPTAPRGPRQLEDAFRMPPASSTSVGYLGDAVGHRDEQRRENSAHRDTVARRFSQSSQPPTGPSSSRATTRLSPPIHRTLPPPSPSGFGSAPSRYGTPRSPVLHRPERLPSPSASKMMVNSMMEEKHDSPFAGPFAGKPPSEKDVVA